MTDPAATQTPLAPPFDPEIEGALLALRDATPALSDDNLVALRGMFDQAPVPDLTAGGRVVVDERLVPGPAGAQDVALTVLSPAAATTGLPAIYYMHGGALVLGNRYMYIDELLPYVAESAAVVVSVGYRFAPEHPAPAQIEDCYAGLTWTAGHAAELGIDPGRSGCRRPGSRWTCTCGAAATTGSTSPLPTPPCPEPRRPPATSSSAGPSVPDPATTDPNRSPA